MTRLCSIFLFLWIYAFVTVFASVDLQGRQLFSFGNQDNSNRQLRPCTTPSGNPGLCQDVMNCPALLLDLRNLVQSICFQSLFRPGTCCPLKSDPTTTTTTTPKTTTTTTTESTTTTSTSTTSTTTRKETTPPPLSSTTVKDTTRHPQSALTSTPTTKPPKKPNVGNHFVSGLRPPEIYPIPENRPTPGTRFSCGVAKATQGRVVNGTESYPGQWPWMAAIYLHSFLGSEFHCGGTVISREYVITAAHCMIDKRGKRFSPSQFSIRLGDNDISTTNEPLDKFVQTFKVRSIQIHENFENFNHQYFRNDIALLKLTRPINFSQYVLPICLPSKAMAKAHVDSLSGEMATVIGYGRISYSGPQSKKLLKATMPVWWNKACDDSYFPPILETNVCAGYVEGGIDSCQGDSGGPLLIYRHGKWVLLGIVSFGQKCAEPGYPGVYTRVPKFLEWIQTKARN